MFILKKPCDYIEYIISISTINVIVFSLYLILLEICKYSNKWMITTSVLIIQTLLFEYMMNIELKKIIYTSLHMLAITLIFSVIMTIFYVYGIHYDFGVGIMILFGAGLISIIESIVNIIIEKEMRIKSKNLINKDD